MPVLIASCPTHGLHGERQDCHECGAECVQVPLFTVEEVRLLMARGVARVQRAQRDTEADMHRFTAKDAEAALSEVLEEAKGG
jgi:hypothetical protein